MRFRILLQHQCLVIDFWISFLVRLAFCPRVNMLPHLRRLRPRRSAASMRPPSARLVDTICGVFWCAYLHLGSLSAFYPNGSPLARITLCLPIPQRFLLPACMPHCLTSHALRASPMLRPGGPSRIPPWALTRHPCVMLRLRPASRTYCAIY